MIERMEKLPTKKIIFMIVLLFIPLFFFYLGTPGLWDEDESIYAEISRQMMLRHDFVGTYFNYEPRFDKPPLNFWINAAFYKIFGMNELTTRMGSTLFGFCCLILAYLFGKRLFNKRTGILAAFMLGTGFLFFIETQMALIDTSLTFLIGLTLYFFYRGYTEGKAYLLMLMGIPLGLGILAKGPVAVIIASAVAFIFWLFQTIKYKIDWRKLWNWQLLTGFAIAAAICLPWYFMMWSRYGMDFIQSHFGYHMIKRFTEPIEHHGGEWYYSLYYIILLVIGFMPWGAYIPGSFRFALKRWSDSKVFFLLTWLVITLGFFTVAQTKLPGYALPLFIPCALLMGSWWDQLFNSTKLKTNPWWGFMIQLVIVLGIVTFTAFHRAMLPPGYQGIIWVLFLLPLSLGLGVLFFWLWPKKKQSYRLFFNTTFITYYLFWALFLLLLVPVMELDKPVKYLAVELPRYLSAGDKVISVIPSNFTAPFYTRHKVIFLHRDAGLTEYYRNKSYFFAFVDRKTLAYLKRHNLAFYQLSQYGSGYLISNRPVQYKKE
jgi:4-amino-4-deoxy-L-arabinose transferase and related glycosyltransferases of PMT family